MTVRFTAFATMTLSAAASLAMSGCGGGGGTPSGGGPSGPPPPITVTRTFPSGRATPTNGGTAWNIIGVTTILTGEHGNANGNLYDTLTVKTTLSQDATNALPAPGQNLLQPTQLGVVTAFNVSAYGIAPVFADCTSEIRDGYAIDDSMRRSDGSYGIGGFNGEVTGVEVLTNVSGSVVTQSLPIAAIGVAAGQKVPTFNLSVAAENGAPGPLGFTDCVPPDGSQISVNGA